MRKIDEIIVHCSATRPDWMVGATSEMKRDAIKRWHKDKGWRDIGYHGLIDRDGTRVLGRPYAETGAHVRGRNKTTIGLCLLGGHGSSENDAFEDNFTPEQDKELRKWITELRAQFPTIKKVSGHNQYAAKACPGFSVSAWLAKSPVKGGDTPKTKTAPQAGLQALLSAILNFFRRSKR